LILNVSASAVAGSTLTNTASVAADQNDPKPANNTATSSAIVSSTADLRLIKDCKPDVSAPAGSTATCTIYVDNLGLSDAQNVVVTDTHISNGAFTITSATFTPPPSTPCAVAGGVVTCNLGTEPAGGRTTITVLLTSSDSVDVNDTACVASTTPDPDTTNNCGQDSVHFRGGADLSITKTSTPNPVTAGTNLTYTVTVKNNGPSSATNVVMKDILPAQTTVVSAVPTVGVCAGTTITGDPLQPLTCTLGTMANGATVTITIVVTVKPGTADGVILINNASVSAATNDPNNANNVVTAATNVQTRADLSITKTSDFSIYNPLQRAVYTITVKNNGTSDAKAVVVTDNLPPLLLGFYQSDTGNCLRPSQTQLTCNLGDMKVGETKTFIVVFLLDGRAAHPANRDVWTVSNTVIVSSATTDPSTGNNTAVRTVTVRYGNP
jgi:uncharacterized repeat protein (TIGR01451 family)